MNESPSPSTRASEQQEQLDERTELSPEEMDAEAVDVLPERQAMSKIDVGLGFPIDNFAMPINEATAMNIASTNSAAIADADQIIILNQTAES